MITSDKLYLLPKGWVWTTLGDVVEKLLEQIREEKVKQESKKGRKTNNKVKNLTRG